MPCVVDFIIRTPPSSGAMSIFPMSYRFSVASKKMSATSP